MITYQTWPFRPTNTHTQEQRQQWWQDCFVSTSEVTRFIQSPASAVLIGGPGSGKSTAIAALHHTLAESALLIPYLPHHWPSGTRPWVPGENHLSQILAAAATEISHKLSETPELYIAICHEKHCQQFLFWLIEKHLSRRALIRLLHRLRQSLNLAITLPDTLEDLYTNTHETDVWNQLDELVYLAQTLKYKRIVVTIDLSDVQIKNLLNDLQNLFGWLDLFEYPEFAIRAAIPQSVNSSLHLTQQANGRLELITLSSAESSIQEIVSRHLQVATNGTYSQLQQLADLPVLQRLQTEIQQLYNSSALAGWLQWAETLLIIANQQLPVQDPETATIRFYQRHIPLRLETVQSGVWRGPQFIPLDQQLYEFLGKLFTLRGRPDPNSLQAFAGNSDYLNKLASRLRKEIEPLPGENIYLQNRRDRGYWLENFLL